MASGGLRPLQDAIPTVGLLSPAGEDAAIPGLEPISLSRLGDVDFVYAPLNVLEMMTRTQMANVRLALACNQVDFVLVSESLKDLPMAGVTTIRNHVVFSSRCAGSFLNGETPFRPLQGMVLDLPSGRSVPIRDLREVFQPWEIAFQSHCLTLGTTTAATPRPFQLSPNIRWCDAMPTKPVVFVLPIFLAVGGVERNTITIMRELRHLYDFVVINTERLCEKQGSLHHQASEVALAVYDLAEIATSDAHLSLFHVLKASYSPRLVWICNGAPWLCDHARELREVFRDTPIVDQEVYDTKEGWIQRYQEPGIQSFDRFIAINRPIQRRFVDDFKMDPGRVDLIYPTLNTDRFQQIELASQERRRRLEQHGLPEGRRLFAFVGRLTSQKRPLDFLELARREQDAGGQDLFVMIGEGELSKSVEAFIVRHRLTNVRRIPFCDAMAEILPLFSGIIITSQFEGLPIAMLEALCMGVPALATDVGDIRYVLEHFGNGRVVPKVGDAAVLHHEFRIWQSQLATYQASQAASGVREMFTSRNIARQYQECWQRAMAKYGALSGPHYLGRRVARHHRVGEEGGE